MEYMSYKNKQFGFKLQHPASWECLDDNPLYAAAFLSQYEESSKYRVEIIINVIDLSEKPRTYEELIKEAPGSLKMFLNDFKIFKQQETSLGDQKAHQIIYSGRMKFGRQKDLDLKYLQTMTLVNNKTYSISYSHGTQFFENYLDIVHKMIASFEFF